ncbi:hypothetical protein, partial [Salmonella enterica]|uniref:hypothetical protein n=1 Tax=Salmonella enterica TaxID=28901 RepID=UPI003299B5D5
MQLYPGHPGSDDIALRLGLRARENRRPFDAARWFARSAALPDQDFRLGALSRLVAVCELELTPVELDRL